MAEVVVVGTSHISKDSVNEIKKVFDKLDPDTVAIELDNRRLYSLLNKEGRKVSVREMMSVGLKGYLFAIIGGMIQRKLGKYVGSPPGSDMLAAFNIARDNKKRIALIDRDITVTLKRFSKSLSWKERMRFIYDLLFGIFTRRKDLERMGIRDFGDLKKVPSEKIVNLMIGELKERYPNVYKVLVEERNRYMAREIKKLIDNGAEKVLVVAGAGHKGYLERKFNRGDSI